MKKVLILIIIFTCSISLLGQNIEYTHLWEKYKVKSSIVSLISGKPTVGFELPVHNQKTINIEYSQIVYNAIVNSNSFDWTKSFRARLDFRYYYDYIKIPDFYMGLEIMYKQEFFSGKTSVFDDNNEFKQTYSFDGSVKVNAASIKIGKQFMNKEKNILFDIFVGVGTRIRYESHNIPDNVQMVYKSPINYYGYILKSKALYPNFSFGFQSGLVFPRK